MTIPNEAKCKVGLLHDFTIIGDDEKLLAEECKLCLKKVHYNKKDGRVDNVKHYLHHVRDTLQPVGSMLPLYELVYGKVVRKQTPKKKSMDEAAQETKDLIRYWNKKPSKDPWVNGSKEDFKQAVSGKI